MYIYTKFSTSTYISRATKFRSTTAVHTGYKGPHLKFGTADRIPRETLEERLEKTGKPENAK
jgi:hypothetical protein